MGSGASKVTSAVNALAVPAAGLEDGWSNGNEMCFPAIPQNQSLLKRSQRIVLEIGPQGFRVLRPSLEPLCAFAWGTIHSWAHNLPDQFAFRWYEESTRKLNEYSFVVKDVEAVLAHMQVVVDHILKQRLNQAISQRKLDTLLEALIDGAGLELVVKAAEEYYFTAEQGRSIIQGLSNPWDKVEAAVLLHGRLVDQPKFNHMLEALDVESRDNVWHRVMTVRKQVSGLPMSQMFGKPAGTSGRHLPPSKSVPLPEEKSSIEDLVSVSPPLISSKPDGQICEVLFAEALTKDATELQPCAGPFSRDMDSILKAVISPPASTHQISNLGKDLSALELNKSNGGASNSLTMPTTSSKWDKLPPISNQKV